MKCTSEEVFENMKKLLKEVQLPNEYWSVVTGNSIFFGFQKVEKDYRVRKRIAVYRKMNVKLYIDNVIDTFFENEKIENVSELTEILKAVDDMEIGE